MDCYKMLALAIVEQAVKDYKNAVRYIEKHRFQVLSGKQREKMNEKIRQYNDCICFFRSQWFYELTGCEGRELLKRLDKEMEKRRGMNLAEAIRIFKDIQNKDYSDAEKMEAIHVSMNNDDMGLILKKEMKEVILWMERKVDEFTELEQEDTV